MNIKASDLTTIKGISPSEKERNNLFPIFVKLEQLRLLIVGGGYVGLEKLQAVLENAPETQITLVALQISDEIKAMAPQHHITLVERAFEPHDLDETDLVLVGINDKEKSREIAQLTRQKGLLVNVADTPDLCDFYLSSVVQKGNLKLAISTNGKSPTIAKRLKETLNESMPAEMDQVLDQMQAIRGKLTGDFQQKVKKLNEITSVLVNDNKLNNKWRKLATWSLVIFASMLLGHFILSYIPFKELGVYASNAYLQLGDNFYWLLLIGFTAQLVDGALGMGYGLTSATALLSLGVNPAAISGSIHTAEMFASGMSGYSHYKFGNVNKRMFWRLVIPGVIGAIFGAILLVYFGDSQAKYIRPILATYTMFLGIKFIMNAFKDSVPNKKFKHYRVLAGIGGFLDSFGGGGWGPIVTSTLINKGRSPRYVIGTVSLTEFFVTLSSAFSFFLMIGVTHWQVILGLLLGGMVAAPLAAKLVGIMPRKTAFLLLGVLVIIWSTRLILKSF